MAGHVGSLECLQGGRSDRAIPPQVKTIRFYNSW